MKKLLKKEAIELRLFRQIRQKSSFRAKNKR